jgi:FAD:protein FMN transferase
MWKEVFSRKRILPLLFAIVVLIIMRYVQSNRLQQVAFSGRTMGTTYNIKYRAKGAPNYQQEVDSVLALVNESLSTYIPGSEISRFNRESEVTFKLPYFYPVLEKSREIYQKTSGAFDPTVGPLVNAWGFGPSDDRVPDSAKVDSLLNVIGFEHIQFNEQKVWKDKAGVQLDMSAIAKGYGVDVVAVFLQSKGIEHLMVEIGGEVVCRGESKEDQAWRIGIDDPLAEETGNRMKAVVTLKDRALATSGNYRNYYVKDGVKYAHTISPFTGYPVQHSLLSASVFAPDCQTADAFATAFMVMGLEKAKAILEKEEGLDALLVYSDKEGNVRTFITEGIKPFIQE